MKRILPLLISFSLIFTLAACGHGDEDTSTEEVLTGTVRYMNADPEFETRILALMNRFVHDDWGDLIQ